MATPTLSDIGIPGWAQTQLQKLASEGKLSGVNPVDIGLIGRAESSYNPGPYNGPGYGGYFGTSQAESGVSDPTNPSTFGQQAQAAAKVFAAGLRASGGNVVGAENYYQTGSTAGNRLLPNKDGSVLFNDYFGGAAKQSASSSGSNGFTPSTPPSLSLGPLNLGLEGLVSGGISGVVIIGAVILILAAALLLTKTNPVTTVQQVQAANAAKQAAAQKAAAKQAAAQKAAAKQAAVQKAVPNTTASTPATNSGAEVLFDGDPYE